MEAFVITLEGHEYSERVAKRCIETGHNFGVEVGRFAAVAADKAVDVMRGHGLEWTWGNGGAGLVHHSYGGDTEPRIGCAMSHYLLWQRCADSGPMLILEHDAVFIAPFREFRFMGACQVNNPNGATPRGDWWSNRMAQRGPGVWPKTVIFDNGRPDGLAGNSAYVLQPEAARVLIALVEKHGLWPNDAIMCRQLVPFLEEHYPFITEVREERSTIR